MKWGINTFPALQTQNRRYISRSSYFLNRKEKVLFLSMNGEKLRQFLLFRDTTMVSEKNCCWKKNRGFFYQQRKVKNVHPDPKTWEWYSHCQKKPAYSCLRLQLKLERWSQTEIWALREFVTIVYMRYFHLCICGCCHIPRTNSTPVLRLSRNMWMRSNVLDF